MKTSFHRTAVEYVRLQGHSYANSRGAESAKLTNPDKGPCDPEEMWGGHIDLVKRVWLRNVDQAKMEANSGAK